MSTSTSSDAAAFAPASVAYFSMEIALEDAIPTFSGGLGVLAGDFLMSVADLSLPLVAVTLCYRDGYFLQELDRAGHQVERPVVWRPADVLEAVEETVEVEIAGRRVVVGAWRYSITGESGHVLPVFLLDTNRPENDAPAAAICDQLYGGDNRHRLEQEIVLGIGGAAMLERLGYRDLEKYHMNEGHSSLLTLALLESELRLSADLEAAVEHVQQRCVFTTHTPVPAGHDQFDLELVTELLGEDRRSNLAELGLLEERLNMTELGLRMSGFANGVSLRHGEVSREMFPHSKISAVTNGVHLGRWASAPMADLFDRHIQGWRGDNALLHYATAIDPDEIAAAHQVAKTTLLDEVRRRTGHRLAPDALTIGLARRATPYKQTSLIFSDLDRLRSIAAKTGPLQIICSGKAHPRDEPGKELVTAILSAARALTGQVEVVFVENYDLGVASLLVAGSDLWLNNPVKPHEASGTSGMKAALNGVPSLSILDGWWIEGWVEGVTGWAIGNDEEEGDDAEALYSKLGDVVAPLFHSDYDGYVEVMRHAIALNASFFNTERMAREYALSAYHLR